MYEAGMTVWSRCGVEAGKKFSIWQQKVALFGLILPLFVWGSDVRADDHIKSTPSLEQALRKGGKGFPRFHMRNGQSIVGRFVQLKGEAVTIRRPAGGLRSIGIAEINNVEIADSHGRYTRGWITAFDDGTILWSTKDP